MLVNAELSNQVDLAAGAIVPWLLALIRSDALTRRMMNRDGGPIFKQRDAKNNVVP